MSYKKEIFDSYAVAVAKQFHLNLDEMFNKNKRRDLVDARQMLYYLCMERPIRVSYIQRFMSSHGCDVFHSTVLHGYKKANEQVEKDPDYKAVVDLIELQNLKIPSV